MTNRIYCMSCKKFYQKESTGYSVTVSNDGRVMARGDLYQCSGCGHTVMGDFGENFEVVKK